jgi:hypothetical protein
MVGSDNDHHPVAGDDAARQYLLFDLSFDESDLGRTFSY